MPPNRVIDRSTVFASNRGQTGSRRGRFCTRYVLLISILAFPTFGTLFIYGKHRLARTAAPAPPSVTISNPAIGATFTAPAAITITATASDSDGTVTKVEFFGAPPSWGKT